MKKNVVAAIMALFMVFGGLGVGVGDAAANASHCSNAINSVWSSGGRVYVQSVTACSSAHSGVIVTGDNGYGSYGLSPVTVSGGRYHTFSRVCTRGATTYVRAWTQFTSGGTSKYASYNLYVRCQ